VSRSGKRRTDRLAPSIQRAHRRVTWTWWVSWVHGIVLAALGFHLLLRVEPAWILGVLCLVGTGVIPFLGTTAYRGNSFSALLLLASAVVPTSVAVLREWSWIVPLVGVFLSAVYFLGLKGATGLRGRRGSRSR